MGVAKQAHVYLSPDPWHSAIRRESPEFRVAAETKLPLAKNGRLARHYTAFCGARNPVHCNTSVMAGICFAGLQAQSPPQVRDQ
jgi:hypothetical protein